MRLFPYTINRISGSSIDNWSKFNFKELISLNEWIIEAENQLTQCKGKLISALEQLIGKCEDEKLKKLLINCKRSVFNERHGDLLTLSGSLGQILNEGTQGLFRQYQDQLVEYGSRLSGFGPVYDKEVEANRKILIDLTGIDAFQSGLVLSSHSLLHQIKSLSRVDLQPKKRIEIEVGALKFLTRIFTKTTPYSTFTNLSYDNLNSDKPTATGEVKSMLYTNNRVLWILINLLESYLPVYNKLKARLNPSIQRQGDNFSFLVSSSGVESIQSLKANPLLEWMVSELPAMDLTYEQLRSEVFELVDESSQQKTDSFLRQLARLGFIKVNVPISGLTHNWEEKLLDFLPGLALGHDPHIGALINLLHLIQDSKKEYATASQDERMAQLKSTLEAIEKVVGSLAADCEPVKGTEENKEKDKYVFNYEFGTTVGLSSERLFYEDTTVDADASQYNSFIKSEVPKIQELISQLQRISDVNKVKQKILEVYKATYGDKVSVPLLEFYKHYKQAVSGQQEWKLKNEVSTPWENLLNEIIGVNNSTTGPIHISTKQIKEGIDNLQLKETEKPYKPYSYGAYVQCYKDSEGNPNLVLNGVTDGYGRLVGRFLHLFPNEITALLQQWNSNLSDSIIGSEINDTSYFNANIKPNLMPYEVAVDVAYSNHPVENRIVISDVELRYDKQADEIYLYTKGKKVSAFVLGLQFELGRSPLLSFLSNFNDQENSQLPVLSKVIPFSKIMTNSQYRPRLILERSIVLSRAKWKINKADLPIQQNNESNHEFYLRVNKWRVKHGIPSKVFIRTNATYQNISKGGSKDERKPQFLDFTNPLMVNLFAKQSKKVTQEMHLEEMLPGVEEMNRIGEHKHALEQIVTWYSNQ